MAALAEAEILHLALQVVALAEAVRRDLLVEAWAVAVIPHLDHQAVASAEAVRHARLVVALEEVAPPVLQAAAVHVEDLAQGNLLGCSGYINNAQHTGE